MRFVSHEFYRCRVRRGTIQWWHSSPRLYCDPTSFRCFRSKIIGKRYYFDIECRSVCLATSWFKSLLTCRILFIAKLRRRYASRSVWNSLSRTNVSIYRLNRQFPDLCVPQLHDSSLSSTDWALYVSYRGHRDISHVYTQEIASRTSTGDPRLLSRADEVSAQHSILFISGIRNIDMVNQSAQVDVCALQSCGE